MSRTAAPPRLRGDRASSLVALSGGVLVVLLFLTFAVQLLFGLYAATTVTAVANDAARRAAADGAPDRGAITSEARRALGRVGETASFEWGDVDADGDGAVDTVVLTIVASPPRFVPPSIGGQVGLDEIRRTAHARIEEVR